MSSPLPSKLYYSIGEVCKYTNLEPHVLRYWESEFNLLRPKKNRAGNRVYRQKDLTTIRLIKHLLYEERYTIEGARRKLVEIYRQGGQLDTLEDTLKNRRLLEELRQDLLALRSLLETEG